MEGTEAVSAYRPAAEGMTCPNCTAVMSSMSLEGHHGREVHVDVCGTCQSIWFDGYESLQLSANSVLKLFRLISESGSRVRGVIGAAAKCPRCAAVLRAVKDMQRTTRFEYRACPQRHGRLISFFNFLREKDFIRPMTPAQIEELRKSVSAVNCSNCGAPVDLAKGTACTHCGSPLSLLDLQQAAKLVADLQQAATRPGRVDRTGLEFDLARARRDTAAKFETLNYRNSWTNLTDGADLVGSTVSLVVSILSDN